MILDRIKAWIALFGAILTAVLSSGIIVTGTWKTVLTIASVIVTAFLTYRVPNTDINDT